MKVRSYHSKMAIQKSSHIIGSLYFGSQSEGQILFIRNGLRAQKWWKTDSKSRTKVKAKYKSNSVISIPKHVHAFVRTLLTQCKVYSPLCSLMWPCSKASSHSKMQRDDKHSVSFGCICSPYIELLSSHWPPHNYLPAHTMAFQHVSLETSEKEKYLLGNQWSSLRKYQTATQKITCWFLNSFFVLSITSGHAPLHLPTVSLCLATSLFNILPLSLSSHSF